MTENDSLIIFVKNPELGKVKTRLAKDIGQEEALKVYQKLLQHTRDITRKLNCTKHVYYSEFVDDADLWDNMVYDKHLQQGADLGERMQNAFAEAFKQGKNRVVIIGSDCAEIQTYMIKEAFAVLESNDVVIGPARDGGYYLLGSNHFYPTLFENKEWSTPNLLMDTLLDLKKMSSNYFLLKTLTDIDNVDDLKMMNKLQPEKPDDWF